MTHGKGKERNKKICWTRLKSTMSSIFHLPRLTDAVSVILSELLSYEHPSNSPGLIFIKYTAVPTLQNLSLSRW